MQDKITKKINLDINDGLSEFMGMPCQQNHNVFGVFYEFLKKVKPSRILEIGTALGGFTKFLTWTSKEINHPIDIISYDIMGYYTRDELIKYGIDARLENIFGQEYNSVNQDVIDFIKSDGITVILCDGGFKIGEFNILSKFLKPGDFIMAHDYSENKKIFDEKINGKIWNWFEISNEDIIKTCIENNLVVYDKELFEDVVWTCRKKIITT